MPRGKQGYSPAYEKRLKAFFAKNPHGTLAEARGHKNKIFGSPDSLHQTEYAIKHKIKLQHVKEKLGIITEKEKSKNISDLQALRHNVRKLDVIPAKTLEHYQNREKSYGIYRKLKKQGVIGEPDTDWLGSMIFYHGG